jgi:hypothetical protein
MGTSVPFSQGGCGNGACVDGFRGWQHMPHKHSHPYLPCSGATCVGTWRKGPLGVGYLRLEVSLSAPPRALKAPWTFWTYGEVQWVLVPGRPPSPGLALAVGDLPGATCPGGLTQVETQQVCLTEKL